MNLVHEEIFKFQENDYMIRIVSKDGEFMARGFLNNRPASYMYCIEVTTRGSFMNSFEYDPLLDMIESIKKDIKGEIWQKHLHNG